MAIRRRASEPGRSERKIQIEEVAPERRTARGIGDGAGTDCQDLVRARPVKGESGLGMFGVGVHLHTLADGGGKAVHSCRTTCSGVWCWAQRAGNGGVSAVNTTHGEDLVCTDNVVCALLLVGGHVAIGWMVTGQTLASGDAGAVGIRKGETWESAHVDLVGRRTRRRADRMFVSEIDAVQKQVPIVLLLFDDRSQHFGHSLVYPINAPITVGMIGACSRLAHAQQLVI